MRGTLRESRHVIFVDLLPVDRFTIFSMLLGSVRVRAHRQCLAREALAIL